jgi:multiple sugar transport system substrate-binding protein
MNITKKLQKVLLFTLVAVLVLPAALTRAQDAVTIRYGMWDPNQVAPYQKCADGFTKANPNITIKIEQQGWLDYWTGVQTAFVAGDAPDVITDHLAKYPEFARLQQIVDIQPLVDRDKVPTDIYYPGLADLWTREGKRYGLPKDWDTIGIIYNVEAVKKAGVDPEVMKTWTWNAKDGGSFGEVVAKLTLDSNGNNGLSDKFDKTKVVQYGFNIADDTGWGGGTGQPEWSAFAVSNGFKYNNGVWGDKYYYDDPKLAETLQWFADLSLKKGYAPPYADAKSLNKPALFQSKKVAMTIDGSWQIGTYASSEFPVAFGRLPAGPNGRKSMFNGLADSIFVGTKHMEEAWKWVKYLASADCQNIIGEGGVVFPAIASGVAKSLEVRKAKGIDVTAFTDQAAEKDGTFLFPITDHASEINTIMTEADDNIALGKMDAATALKAANDEVNKLFQ